MDRDEIIDRGRDVQEMEKSPGWTAVKSQLQSEIEESQQMLQHIEIAGRSPADVGAAYIAIIQRVSGLKRTLEIVESIKEDGVREQQNENTQG